MTDGERAPSGWIPVLIAIAANSWILAMPFQGDDYLILPKVGEALGIELATPSDDARSDTHIGNFYLFRPVPWFIWWATIKVQGGYADPFVFHAVALLVHALTSWVLWRVLRVVLHPRAAQIGACFFALAPGAVQATSFIAAGGDQYAVLFMLLAAWCLQRHRKTASMLTEVLAGACVALAFCSKDVAIVSLPAVILAALAVPASRPGTLRRPIVFMVIFTLVAMGIRSLYLHRLWPAYLTVVRVGLADLRKLPDLFLDFLVPWRRFAEVAGIPPMSARIASKAFPADPARALRLAGLAAFLLPIAAGLLVRPARVAVRIALLAGALVCVLLPALAIYDPSYTQVISRVFYPAAAICGAALAAGVDPICERRAGRWILWPLLLPLALLSADLMVHVARTELMVGKMVGSRLESLEELVSRAGPDAHVIAVDEQFAVGGIPTLYFGVGPAMKPPLSRSSHRVTWWADLTTLPRSPILLEEKAPIVIARISEDRYVLREPVIGPLPPELPALVKADAGGTEWRCEAPLPARAVAGVRIGSPAEGVFACTWIGSRGRRETRVALPGLGDEPRAIVSAPDDFDWLADPVLLGVRFEGATVDSCEALRQLPEIRIVKPSSGERLPAGSGPWTVPEVAFVTPDQPLSREYRLMVEFAINDRDRPMMVSEEPAFILKTRPDGARVYDVAKQASNTIVPSPATNATNLVTKLDEVLRMSGSGLLPLSIRVEAFDPRSRSVEARSRWTICFLELRE